MFRDGPLHARPVDFGTAASKKVRAVEISVFFPEEVSTCITLCSADIEVRRLMDSRIEDPELSVTEEAVTSK